MSKNLYQETFSHVRSSYTVNVEDFEKMKTKRTTPVKNIILIAAVVAVLAAFGITAAATDFFGLSSVTLSDEGGSQGLISMQGYRDSAEYKALRDYYYGGLTLDEAAEKHGLTVPDRCEVYEYDDMVELLGGELTDGRNTRWAFVVYEDGTFSADQSYTDSEGNLIVSYQMYRAVKGSLTEVALNADSMGDDYEEWDVKIGSHDVGLVLGSDDRSLIIADLGDSFFMANVLAGKRADPTFGGPITREQLEELAKSMNWDVLSKVVVPEFSPAEPEVRYGAGVELEPAYIDEEQSFTVNLRDYGETRFITYLPTPEFDDVRFFLSSDGKTSDYEFHPMFNDNESVKVAAVSIEDLTGDGCADVLVLVDYVTPIGREYRDIRIFTYDGGGEYDIDETLCGYASAAIPAGEIDVASVREYCKEYFAEGRDEKNETETRDQVVASRTIEEGGKSFYLEAMGKRSMYDDRWGIREIRVYPYGDHGKPLAEPVQVIRIEDAGEDFVDGLYAGYTECPDKESVMTALDMNLDGYTDIGVFGWIPNNTIPCYYWFWNESAGQFEYAITLQGAEVDEDNHRIIESFKSGGAGSEYTCNYYQPDGNGNLVLVDTKVEKYGDFVEANDYEGMLLYLQSQYTDPFWLTYGLFDLTGDGTEELIATYGTCEADFEAGVWSMDTGKMRKLGAFGVGHSRLYVVDGKLTRLMGHMGYELISQIGFDGTQVTETTVSERTLGPEDEYRIFDTPFEMAKDSDLTLLHGVDKYAGYKDVLDTVGESASYALFDIDFNGTKELIIAEDDNWFFFTVENGKVVELGELLSIKSSLHVYGDGHELAVFYSNMSGADIHKIITDGVTIDTVFVTGWEWKEGVAGEDPGEELTFRPVTDRSLLP